MLVPSESLCHHKMVTNVKVDTTSLPLLLLPEHRQKYPAEEAQPALSQVSTKW